MTPEHQRLTKSRENTAPWKKWGPYLSDRQWGTVREDYSAGGSAWDDFSHQQSYARAYRWGGMVCWASRTKSSGFVLP